ncbi:MAG: tetratricopeptide repeat protein [Thermoanaerobaculales bacterium]
MIRTGPRILVFLVAAVLVVETLDTVGWWRWNRARQLLAINPEAGAMRLISDPWLKTPGAVRRSRRLVSRDLGSASRETVINTLGSLGARQQRWLPADPIGYSNLARESLLEDQSETAIELIDQAIVRDPTSPHLRRLRALALMFVGRREEALRDLSLAEGISPGLRSPRVDLAPEDERAVRLEGLRLRRELYPRSRVNTAIALAGMLRSTGDEAGAQSVLVVFRGRPEVELELARWALDSGEYDKAEDLLTTVTSRSALPRPLRARAWSLMATARDLGGDSEGAQDAVRAAIRLAPGSIAPYIALADVSWRRGEPEQALFHLRRAWGMAPADVHLLARIATVAEAAGKRSDAILALERAVELAPNSPDLVARLIEVQLRAGDYTEAAMELSRALDRFSTDARLLNLADRLRREVGIR